jgi:hypothetical protein
LNPVRARCVERPEQYRWSSYPGYHNPRRTCAWTTYEKVLGEFGRDPKKARAAYRQFVAAGVQEKPVSPFSQAFGGVVVGSETFIARVRAMLSDRENDPAVPELGGLASKPSLETIRETVAEEFGVEVTDWTKGRRSDDVSRAVAAYLARRCFGYRSKDVAAALGYSSAGGVGQAIGRVDAARSRIGRIVQELARRLANGY